MDPTDKPAATSEYIVGNMQVMPQLVAMAGAYPVRGDQGAPQFVLGMIQTSAVPNGVFGAPPALGQMLPIQSNPQLFSVLGAAYGGNGTTVFALPDLAGRVAIGGAPVGEDGGTTLTFSYIIAAVTGGVAPTVATVALFCGNYPPVGWLTCDGSMLSASDYPELFAAIGTIYGGGGVQNFALPNLGGAAAVGAGTPPGRPPILLGQKIDGTISGLGLNYMICASGGIYPSPDGGDFLPTEPWIGQVTACAASAMPQGWLPCDGALLPIVEYQILYSLLGPTYGGDGVETFALPDLRGRMVTGTTS